MAEKTLIRSQRSARGPRFPANLGRVRGTTGLAIFFRGRILISPNLPWYPFTRRPRETRVSSRPAASPSRDSRGQRLTLGDLATFPDPVPDPTFEIVAADVKNQGLQKPVIPEVWVPYTVTGAAERGVLVRTAGDPKRMLNAVSRTVWSVDRGVALTLTDTAESFINQFALSQPRFGLYLLGVFAAVGLVLVTIGVYGVIAYAVSRQTHEIGIRMALGAGRPAVLRMVLRAGLRLPVIGVAIGLAGSILLSRTRLLLLLPGAHRHARRSPDRLALRIAPVVSMFS